MEIPIELQEIIDPNKECCCVYHFSNKCKEWAYSKGYSVRCTQTSIGWVIDLLHENRDNSISNYSLIVDKTITGTLLYELFPRKTGLNTIHPKHFVSEIEAVFKACQWILDNKDN